MDHTTFIMLKPDALEGHLENKILDEFRDHGNHRPQKRNRRRR